MLYCQKTFKKKKSTIFFPLIKHFGTSAVLHQAISVENIEVFCSSKLSTVNFDEGKYSTRICQNSALFFIIYCIRLSYCHLGKLWCHQTKKYSITSALYSTVCMTFHCTSQIDHHYIFATMIRIRKFNC